MPWKNKINWRHTLRWVLWVLLVQVLLANISAALYAYRFTHFKDGPAPRRAAANLFEKTWRLFSGPRLYKNPLEDEPPFPFEEVEWTTGEGLSIKAWYGRGDTARPCILLFHGLTVNRSYLLAEAAQFQAWGYPVVLVDFRAHGKSGGSAISFGVNETEEVALAMQFAGSRGHRKKVVYGTSLGAVVAMRAAGRGEVRPDALIADMPFGSLHEHLRARAVADGGMPSEPFGSLVTFWMGVENGYNGFRHDVARYAQGVRCPVLLQWGTLDPYVSRTEMDRVFAALSPSSKRFVVYEGASHESFLRSDRLAWQSAVQALLREVK